MGYDYDCRSHSRCAVATALILAGACNRASRMVSDWHITGGDVDITSTEIDFVLPLHGEMQGNFQTTVFSLLLVPIGTFGYGAVIENRTRFPLEVDWKRSALTDADGWTHPLMYPGFRVGGWAAPNYLEDDVPVIIAPHGKRVVALVSRLTLMEGGLPFRPMGNLSSFRRAPSKETAMLEEGIFLVVRYSN